MTAGLRRIAGAIAAVLLLSSAFPGLAQESADRTGKLGLPSNPEIIVIPFAPPVDRDLRYDVSVTKRAEGKDKINRIEQRVRFARADDGYVMTVQMLRGGIPGIDSIDLAAMQGKSAPAFLKAFLAPMAFELGADGGILRMRDWPRMQQVLRAAPDEMSAFLESDPLKRAAARKIFETIMSGFAALGAEQAPAMMLKGWPSVLGHAGTEVEANTDYEVESELPVGVLPVAIPVKSRLSVSHSADGARLLLRQTSTPDQAVMRAALSDYFVKLGAGLDESGKANLRKAAEQMQQIEISDDLAIDFDASTGLVEQARIQRNVSLSGENKGGETIVIERVNAP